MARRFGQQEVFSLFINVYKLVYITFINLAVAFDAPTHQDINIYSIYVCMLLDSCAVASYWWLMAMQILLAS